MMIKKIIVLGSIFCAFPVMGSEGGTPLFADGEFLNTDDGMRYLVPSDVNIHEFRDPQKFTFQEVAQQIAHCIIGHIEDSNIVPFVVRLKDYLCAVELGEIRNAHIALKSKDGSASAPTFAEFLDLLEFIPPYQKDDPELAGHLISVGCDTKNFQNRVHLLAALIEWVQKQPKDKKKGAQSSPALFSKPVKSPRKIQPMQEWFAKTAIWRITGITLTAAAIAGAVLYQWHNKKDNKTTPSNG